MRKDIVIGQGDFIVAGIGQANGMEGIGLFSSPEHNREIDDCVPMEEIENRDPDFVIWFTGLKAARLFQDQASAVAMRMNGYEVKNKKQGPL